MIIFTITTHEEEKNIALLIIINIMHISKFCSGL